MPPPPGRGKIPFGMSQGQQGELINDCNAIENYESEMSLM